jgi:hypothetical protein
MVILIGPFKIRLACWEADAEDATGAADADAAFCPNAGHVIHAQASATPQAMTLLQM